MAYINTYTFKYRSSANINYVLEFYDQGGNASTWANQKGTLGAKNCTISFGSENAKMYSPLKPSTLTIDFMVTGVLDANYLKQLRDNRQERDVYVYLYNTGASPVKIPGDSPMFAGYLLMDLAEDPDISVPFPMKLRAIDGLASLKYYDFIPHGKDQRPDHLYPYPDTWKPGNTNTYNKFYPFRQWISRILRYSGYATTAAGSETDAEIQISVNWFNGNMPNTTGDPLDWTRATADQFYTAEGDTGNIRYKPLTCYDALQFICKTWGMRCFAYKNTFYFIGINTYTETNGGTLVNPQNINWHRYTITGSAASPATGDALDLEWGRYNPPVFIGQPNQKLAGSRYGVLPAFKRVSVDFLNISNINYFQGFPKMPQPWPISTGSGSLRVEEPIGTFDFDGTNSQSFFQEIYLNFQNSSGGDVKYGIRWHIIAKKVGTTTEYQYGYPNWSNSNLMPEWFSMLQAPPSTSLFSRGHLMIPPGASSFNVITDLLNPAWFGNSINMYVTCPPSVFTAGDWEFKYVTSTEWFSGSQNIAYGHGRCDPIPNPGTSYNTDPDSNFITYTDSSITSGVGSSFFSPIANGIIGTEETNTQIVQSGLDTDFEEVTDVLWGDLPGGGAGRLQVYNGTNWVPSGFQGYWGIDSLAGNNSLAETLCEEIFKRQAQNVRKFSTKINLDAENIYARDSSGSRAMYGTPFSKWFTPSHAGSATISASWIMHTGSFDTGSDTWSFSLYEFETFDKGITTTTTGSNGSNSGGVGNDNSTGSLVPSGSAGGVGKTLANPARNNSRAIAKLMQNATRPLTIITGNQGLSAEGTLTVTSLTVQAIPNAVLKAGDTILVMCQYQPEATASLDETNTIEYGNVEFVLSSDQSAGATTLSVVSKTIYQTITKGDVVTISQPDLMAQYQNKTKGSIATLPVTATTIGSATDAIYIQNGLGAELLLNNNFTANPINANNWNTSFYPTGNVLAGSAWTWDSSTYIVTGGIQQGGSNSESQLSQSKTATVGQLYRFQAYVKSSNTKARLHSYTGSPGGSYPGSNFHSGSGNWELLTIDFTATGNAGSTTTVVLRLQLNASTSGSTTYTAEFKEATFKQVNKAIGIGNSTPSTPLDVTGTVNATTFTGDLNGTINTATTGTTQSANNNSTKIATTAYVDAATASVPKGLQYQGTWNAATNTPTIVSGTGVVGYYYIVATPGTTTIDGISEWALGDWIIFTDHTTDHWQKIDQSESDTLQSVTTRGATTTDSITVAGLTTGGNITVSGTVDGRNVSTDGSQLDSNTTNIASNTSSISTNTSNISTNTSSISTNTSNISTNTSNISTNASAIATKAAASTVATNTSNISSNTTDIATNETDIATNTTAISGKASSASVATNTSAIATNTSNVAANTTDIATNTSAIATKAPLSNPSFTGNISVTGTVDGYDISKGILVINSSTGYNMIGSLDPDSVTGALIGRATGNNQPSARTQDGAIINLYKSSSEVAQIWVGMFGDRGRIYVRNKDGGNYQSWIKIINATDFAVNTTNIATNATDISTNTTAITGKVSLTGNETIAGTKSFSSIINANEGINIVGGSIGSGKIILHTNNLMYIRGGSAGLMLQNGDGVAAHQLSSAGNHIFEANGEKMRLVTGGQLLIGHSSSYYAGTKLQVGHTTDSQNGLQITTSTSGYGYVLFGDGTGADAYVGQIAYQHSDNTMRFRANATESFIIKNTGIDIAGNIVITGTVDGRDVSNDGTQLDTNTSAISTNTGNISTNTTNIATNTSAIATKASATSVTTNTANIATNTSNISSNDTDIGTNTTNITSNASNIQTNATNISSNNTDITTNASNISTNTSNISTNTGNITSNTNAIATKASSSSVATNTSNIATNTSNITTNTNNIAGKVSKSGDTMTGLLTGTTATFTSTLNAQGILKLGSTSSDGYITTNTDRHIFIKPAGSGNLYLGDSGEGFNIYHYNSGEDGTYAIYDFNANYYRIRTTQVNGVWINDTLKITGAVTVDSTVDGVDIAARDAVLTSTTSTANTNTSNISTNTSSISTNTGNITTNTTAISGKVSKSGDTITGDLVINNSVLTLNTDTSGGVLRWMESDSNTLAGQLRAYGNRGDIYLYNNGTKKTEITPSTGSFIPDLKIGATSGISSEKLEVEGNIALTGTVDGVDIAARDAVLTSTTSTANTNTSNISTNTSNISTNTSNINLKANIASPEFTTSIQLTDTDSPDLKLYRSGTGQLWNMQVDSSGRLAFREAASLGGTQYTRLQIDDSGEITSYGLNTISMAGTDKLKLLDDDGSNVIFGMGGNLLSFDLSSSSSTRIRVNNSEIFRVDSAGNLTLSGTVDGVDIAARDAVLTSTTSTATTNASNIQTNATNIAANSSDIGTNNTIANAALPKSGGIITGNVTFNDNKKAIFGTSNDGLNIYHNGSNSFIQDTGTGYLALLGSQIKLQSDTEETMLLATPNAGVTLYYDTAAKLATTSTGVSITGSLVVSNDLTATGDLSVRDVTASRELKIINGSGNVSFVSSSTGDLTITAEDDIRLDADGADIVLKDGGTEYARLTHNTGLNITTSETDADLSLIPNGSGRVRVTNDARFLADVTLTDGSLSITQSTGIETFIVTTVFDRVAKFVSTDTAAFLAIQDNTSTDNGVGVLVTGNTLKLLTDNTAALTIDSSQNATFAGTIYLNLSATTQRALTSTGTDSLQIGDAGVQMLRFKNAAGMALDIASNGNATFAGNVQIQKNSPRIEIGTLNTSTGNSKIQFYSKNSGVANGYAIEYNKDTSIDRLDFIDGSGNANIKFNNGGSAEFAGGITTSTAIYAPIYYDSNNTGFYLDPLGTSNLNTLQTGSITASGDIVAPGIYVGSANTSYDFYNNGTTYLNGAVTVDDNIDITGNITVTGTVDGIDIAARDAVLTTTTTTANTNTTALAAKAPIASPTFTGSPAAPTAPAGTNNTKIATTAFVTAAVAAGGGGTVDRGSFAPSAVQSIGSGGVTGTKSTLTFNTSKITAVGLSIASTGIVTIENSGDYMINLNFGTESYLTQNRILGAAEIQYSADGEEWVAIDGSKIYTYNRGIATGEGASTWGTIYEGSGHSGIIQTVADESFIRVQFWVDGRSSSSTGMRTVLNSCRLSLHKLA